MKTTKYTLPVEQSCYWLATRAPRQPEPALRGNKTCDVAIVGAGFTGLWTAHFLKQLDPKLEIAIVEQNICGYGASGRNAGIISSSIDHSHALAVAHFGRDDAAKLAKIGHENIRELAEFAHDCDVELSGQLCFALTAAHLEDCHHSAQVNEELGIKGSKVLTAEEARVEVNSPIYLGAGYSPGGGMINPIKLVDKLRSTATDSGITLYEQTRVTDISGGTITANSGFLTANKVVLATDAYTHHLFPELLWRFIPLYDYVIVSEPLSTAQHQQIGWKNRQGATDGRSFFNYYRLTTDNRIVWGTSEAVYYPPNKVDLSCDHSQKHYDELLASFARHFPYLSELKFPYAWGGPIASTTRLTPFFGSMEGGKVIYALGYTGHGIGTTRLAGKILAHMAIARETDLTQLKMVQKKPFPYPPEPIRSLAVKAVTRSLQQVDAGGQPNSLLKVLDALGLGFSS